MGAGAACTNPATGDNYVKGAAVPQSKGSPAFSFLPVYVSSWPVVSTLGTGWFAPFFEFIRLDANNVYTVVQGNGAELGFQMVMPPVIPIGFVTQFSPTFTPPPGIHVTCSSAGDASCSTST
jgi:hypothetical protein